MIDHQDIFGFCL